jgi:3-isopropylmalate/(R)-2-methylmalate dehydratase small subunit
MTVEELAVRRVTGTGVAIRGNDVDTDQILPARFLKEVSFDKMGEYVFYDARRDATGALNDHPFNRRQGASIVIVNKNFGSGSSREHAPQGLMRWGIEAVIGESFAEIFSDNCTALGMPAVTADQATVEQLQSFAEEQPEAGMELDVERARVVTPEGEVAVQIDPAAQEALTEGIWDTTAIMHANLPETEQLAAGLPYTDR